MNKYTFKGSDTWLHVIICIIAVGLMSLLSGWLMTTWPVWESIYIGLSAFFVALTFLMVSIRRWRIAYCTKMNNKAYILYCRFIPVIIFWMFGLPMFIYTLPIVLGLIGETINYTLYKYYTKHPERLTLTPPGTSDDDNKESDEKPDNDV